MSELIEKLQQELLEIDGKRSRIKKFIRSPQFADLEEIHREMLLVQESAMVKYYAALNIRIGLLLGEDAAKEMAEGIIKTDSDPLDAIRADVLALCNAIENDIAHRIMKPTAAYLREALK